MKKTIQLIIIGCLIGFNLSAQQSFTLEQAIDFAEKNNPSIKNATLGIESANQRVKEIRAIGLPQVNAEAQFQQFIDIPTSIVPANSFDPRAPADEVVELQFGTEFNTTFGVTASQLIFSGSYLVGLQTTKAFKNVSEFQKVKSVLDVKENVIKAYYGVLVSEKTVNTLQEILTTSEKIYAQTKAVFDQGLIEEDNVTQLSLNVLTAKNSLKGAKRQLEDSKNMLKLQMGMKQTETISLTSDFDVVVTSLDSTESQVSSDISQNIDFLMLNQQMELNKLNLKNEKSMYLPTLSAFFTHNQQALGNELKLNPLYPTTIWGLNLSVPIFSSGSRNAKVAQANILLKQSENNLSQLEDGLKVQTKMAKNSYDNAYDTYLTSKKAVDISKKIYSNYQIKFKEGLITSLDLSQIQTQYLSAETQFIQAMYNLVSAKSNWTK